MDILNIIGSYLLLCSAFILGIFQHFIIAGILLILFIISVIFIKAKYD